MSKEKKFLKSVEQLILFPADFHVSHSATPGSVEARRMTATSGLKCFELFPKSNPLSCLVKMFLESYGLLSTMSYLTWKASATPARRLLFRLVPSMPRTGGTGFGFWHTVDTTDGAPNLGSNKKNGPKSLIQVAREMWPTPTVGAGLCGGTGNFQKLHKMKNQGIISEEERRNMSQGNGGRLNPEFVEWLMGLPTGWTDLKCSETAKSFKLSDG